MSSDDTYYHGAFTGLGEINGKGTMVMNNGDSITGTFDGSWASGIKVHGLYKKAEFVEAPVRVIFNLNLSGNLVTCCDGLFVFCWNGCGLQCLLDDRSGSAL